MGDRANWGFAKEAGAPILNLYSHWDGSERRTLLANALAYSRPRWDDEGYATRIVISQIIGDQWSRETGYGLTVNELGDNSYPYLIVFWKEQKVFEIPIGQKETGKAGFKKASAMAPSQIYTFDEFISHNATKSW